MKSEQYLSAKIQQIDRKNPALTFQLLVRAAVVSVIAVLIILAVHAL
jgi:hypothetical protein